MSRPSASEPSVRRGTRAAWHGGAGELPAVGTVGILGGTFNPPHLGHVALARQARTQLGLERVLVMPANVAPNKPRSREDPGGAHRLAMCALAVAHEPGLEVSALEIERGGTSYTVDTVQAIHDQLPEAELTLIMGADTARTLPSWREPVRLLGLAGLAVAERDSVSAHRLDREELRKLVMSTPGLTRVPPIEALAMETIDASSSRARELVAQGRPVAELVGEEVAQYIARHGLYRALAPALAASAPSSKAASSSASGSSPAGGSTAARGASPANGSPPAGGRAR